MTGTNGVATVGMKLKVSPGLYTFQVTGVTHATLLYYPASNTISPLGQRTTD